LEPPPKLFLVHEGENKGPKISLKFSSNSLLSSLGHADLGCGTLVQFLKYLYGICGEAQGIHDPIMVSGCCFERRGEVHFQPAPILSGKFNIF